MKVITKVEYYETQDKEALIERLYTCEPYTKELPTDSGPVDIKVVEETIHGRRYVSLSRGIDVVVGIKGEMAEILGLQYAAYESMQNAASYLQKVVEKQTKELSAFYCASFWKRLKYLFTGII